LRRIAVQATPRTADAHDQELAVTYCVIELYNFWYGFSRSFFLSSALGAKDGSGSRVVVTIVPRPKTVEEALTPAIRLRPNSASRQPPWRWLDEPSWANTSILQRALGSVGASNQAQISKALSASSGVFADLAPFRHFFAHRGEGTVLPLRARIRAHSLPAIRPTLALLLPATVVGVVRPQPLLIDWIDDVVNTVSLAV
jgi:hypothetical protein